MSDTLRKALTEMADRRQNVLGEQSIVKELRTILAEPTT